MSLFSGVCFASLVFRCSRNPRKTRPQDACAPTLSRPWPTSNQRRFHTSRKTHPSVNSSVTDIWTDWESICGPRKAVAPPVLCSRNLCFAFPLTLRHWGRSSGSILISLTGSGHDSSNPLLVSPREIDSSTRMFGCTLHPTNAWPAGHYYHQRGMLKRSRTRRSRRR